MSEVYMMNKSIIPLKSGIVSKTIWSFIFLIALIALAVYQNMNDIGIIGITLALIVIESFLFFNYLLKLRATYKLFLKIETEVIKQIAEAGFANIKIEKNEESDGESV